MNRTARRLGLVLLLVPLAVGAAPFLVYGLCLASLPDYPATPEQIAAIGPEELEVWVEYSGDAPVALQPINPVQYALLLTCDEPAMSCLGRYPGLKAAAHVAQSHLRQTPMRAIWWHLRSAALTVWLTRHWTAEQVLAYILTENRARSSNYGVQPSAGRTSEATSLAALARRG